MATFRRRAHVDGPGKDDDGDADVADVRMAVADSTVRPRRRPARRERVADARAQESLSAGRLLDCRPRHSGWVDKQGYRLFNQCRCLPVWRRRFIVVFGGFLFRFAS